jgi:16S rRNA (cytosine1402-N4)-methyltransferase
VNLENRKGKAKYEHTPVLLAEVLYYLNCKSGSTVVDCTLGGAGHAEAVLNLIAPEGKLIGIDKDDAAIFAARERLARFSQQTKFVKGNFRDLDNMLTELQVDEVDGILLDLGVSSAQIDSPERGFSYHQDGPLDMRMDESQEMTAADVVNEYSSSELTSIIRKYGEERWASRIAQFIVRAREQKPLKTTTDLVKVIKDAVPASARRRGGHPAKQTFQALRIEVNQEIIALEDALGQAVKWLRRGGRMVVISYHSLEDRTVKQVFYELSKGCICPPDLPICKCGKKPFLKTITKKAVRPSKEEIEENSRAKSGRLRAAEKI